VVSWGDGSGPDDNIETGIVFFFFFFQKCGCYFILFLSFLIIPDSEFRALAVFLFFFSAPPGSGRSTVRT